MYLAAEGVPDTTTPLKFRRRLETHDLCKGLYAAINPNLTAHGLLLREDTLLDDTLITAPSSTKNKETQRNRYPSIEKQSEIVALERKIDLQIAPEHGQIKSTAEFNGPSFIRCKC